MRDPIKLWWLSFGVRGTSSFVLAEKLKFLKSKLKVWYKEVFDRVETNKKSGLEKVTLYDEFSLPKIPHL